MLEAKGGNEAMQMIRSQKPDLVVLDLLMPSPDGFEVIRWMRETTRSPRNSGAGPDRPGR